MKKFYTLLTVLFCLMATVNAQKYVGGDLSMLPTYEEGNVVYYNYYGTKIDGDMLEYFRDKAGFNIVRVRLFVNPQNNTGESGVCQDLDYVKKLGKRIKDAGMKFMLDFHYSDFWADPGHQYIPLSWSTDVESIQSKLYSYTKETLQTLKNYGATPDYIQTGNEISYGMCSTTANYTTEGKWESVSYKYSIHPNYDTNWSTFRSFLTQAIKACREECADAKIIIHTERTGNIDQSKNFYQRLGDVDYDIIGLSYYPNWHNGLTTLQGTLSTLNTNFPTKDIMIVETGYFNSNYSPDSNYDFQSTWPASAAGQKAFIDDLVAAVKDLSYVKGLLYWFPEENQYNNTVYQPWYNHGLFNPGNGRSTEALFALQGFIGNSTAVTDEKTEDDITSDFENMGFENGTDNVIWTINTNGWYNNVQPYPQAINQWHSSLVSGNYLMQGWTSSASNLSAGHIFHQSKDNMPAGKYTINAIVHTDYNGIYLFANNDTEIVPATSTWGTAYQVSVETTLTEPGTLTFGLTLPTAPSSTGEVNLYADNFTVKQTTTTGIKGLTSNPSPKGEGSDYRYTLDGRKVSNGKLPKGIYINNGKKIIVK